jgi:hypothetical protein
LKISANYCEKINKIFRLIQVSRKRKSEKYFCLPPTNARAMLGIII